MKPCCRRFWAARTGLEPIDLKQVVLDPALLRRLPKATAERCRAVPLRLDDLTLVVAMADPYDIAAIGCPGCRPFSRNIELIPHVASQADIEDVINHYYALPRRWTTSSRDDSNRAANPPPRPRIITIRRPLAEQCFVFDAAVKRALPTFISSRKTNFVRVRYRIDGCWQQVRALHRAHWPALSHRLKIMARHEHRRYAQHSRRRSSVADRRRRGGLRSRPSGDPLWARSIVVGVFWIIAVRCCRLTGLGFDGREHRAIAKNHERPQGIHAGDGARWQRQDERRLYSILRQLSSVDVKHRHAGRAGS